MVLDVGKLERYPCQILENLVRIGNMNRDNPNHFWNALFMAFRPFRDLTYKQKMVYIQEQREKIAKAIQKKDWMAYGGGFQSNHLILEEFKELFVQEPSSGKEATKNERAVEIVMRIIPDKVAFVDKLQVEDYDTNMVITIVKDMKAQYSKILNDVEKKEGKQISEEKKKKCASLFEEHLTNLWTTSSDVVFHHFVDSIADPETSIPFYIVPLLLSYLDFHVFFIDARGQDVLSINDFYEEHLKTPKDECILVLYDTKRQTYESMGVIDPNDDDEDKKTVCLTRVFEMDDPIAQICYKRIVECH